jgi:hypothetical protein
MKIQTALKQTDCACVFKYNCSNLPAALSILLVDVTGNSRMTTSTQLQPKKRSNMVEEGIRGKASSSSEISFLADPTPNMLKRHDWQH